MIKRSILLIAALLAAASPCAHAAPMRAWATTSTAAANTITNTASATIVADQLVLDPATPNNLRYGQAVTVDCYGVVTTPAAASGTLDVQVISGAGNGGSTITALGDTTAFTPPASLSANAFTLHGEVHFNQASNSAIATFTGDLDIVGAANVLTRYPLRPSGTSGTTGWASFSLSGTPFNLIGVRVTWGTALTTDSITFQSCRFQRVV